MVDNEMTRRANAERLRLIRADLLVRLRPVCTTIQHDAFLEMIEGMAALQLKYELQETDYAAAASDSDSARVSGR